MRTFLEGEVYGHTKIEVSHIRLDPHNDIDLEFAAAVVSGIVGLSLDNKLGRRLSLENEPDPSPSEYPTLKGRMPLEMRLQRYDRKKGETATVIYGNEVQLARDAIAAVQDTGVDIEAIAEDVAQLNSFPEN
ncbi:hypothetical protein KY385_02395 [Candidatus Parcubacteria bacterium]|nr:hypothetical protein [Candidatus Parcubacteria bacterium]